MTIKIERTPELLALLFTYSELYALVELFNNDADVVSDMEWMDEARAVEFFQSFRDALALKIQSDHTGLFNGEFVRSLHDESAQAPEVDLRDVDLKTEATYIDCSASMLMDDEKMAHLRHLSAGDELFFTYKVSALTLPPGWTNFQAVFEHAAANHYKYIRIVTDKGGRENAAKIIDGRESRKAYFPFKIDWRVIDNRI
jgi:hypothetical protein